jgi:hypothetical protein
MAEGMSLGQFAALIQQRIRHGYRLQQPYLSASNVWSTWLRLSGGLFPGSG